MSVHLAIQVIFYSIVDAYKIVQMDITKINKFSIVNNVIIIVWHVLLNISAKFVKLAIFYKINNVLSVKIYKDYMDLITIKM